MDLELLLIASAWCVGFHVVYKKLLIEEILKANLDLMWDELPRWKKLFIKPFYACPYCMASVHGTIIHFSTGGSLLMWIPFCVCLCGINYFAVQFFTE